MTGKREETSMFPPPPVLARLLDVNGIPLKEVPHFELVIGSVPINGATSKPQMERHARSEGRNCLSNL